MATENFDFDQGIIWDEFVVEKNICHEKNHSDGEANASIPEFDVYRLTKTCV